MRSLLQGKVGQVDAVSQDVMSKFSGTHLTVMVFCETDRQRAEPHWMKRMLEECRGLRNLSGSKVQGAEVRLFVAVIGMYCLDTMQEGC